LYINFLMMFYYLI